MGRKSRHGTVTEIKLGKTEKQLMDLIHELSVKLKEEVLTYQDLTDGGWTRSRKYTYILIKRLAKKGVIVRPAKGRFASTIHVEMKEVSLAVRKYLSLIDKRLSDLKEEKEDQEKKLARIEHDLKRIRADIENWEKVRKGLIKNPEAAELFEELQRLK